MRKTEWQNTMLEIVRTQKIATQTEMRAALAERGLECDQGTVSRDIRELGLVKVAFDDGRYVYSVLDDVSPIVLTSRMAVLRQMVRSITTSGNMMVFKCGPGNAPAVGDAIDHLGLTDILGTVAGDDTLFAVLRAVFVRTKSPIR